MDIQINTRTPPQETHGAHPALLISDLLVLVLLCEHLHILDDNPRHDTRIPWEVSPSTHIDIGASSTGNWVVRRFFDESSPIAAEIGWLGWRYRCRNRFRTRSRFIWDWIGGKDRVKLGKVVIEFVIDEGHRGFGLTCTIAFRVDRGHRQEPEALARHSHFRHPSQCQLHIITGLGLRAIEGTNRKSSAFVPLCTLIPASGSEGNGCGMPHHVTMPVP